MGLYTGDMELSSSIAGKGNENVQRLIIGLPNRGNSWSSEHHDGPHLIPAFDLLAEQLKPEYIILLHTR
ncbi:uncharacterized protein EAE97_009353 [Botrytis byssoidea]|uniref:Uncharacterized protein n=1 Tax=Botrytis byssoidea TaxID=139641 RepID=A0A9P5I9Z2_9HELO|nr:uncharacterized protein EAE97_009353 [Botrytis byssoidea]KAF7931144.1 hypothetical protein EAE97_009353 [Botrytis byssoidea]